MPTAPTFTGAPTSTASGFAGTGTGSYADLGISATQAGLHVTVQNPSGSTTTNAGTMAQSRGDTGVPQPNTTETVANLLAQFNTLIVSDPAQANVIAQQLYSAGLMSDSVYNSGQISNSDIYNAYKKAVLGAAATGKPLGDYIIGATGTFQAQGGPRVKLPNVRYTATLTSMADVLEAGDSVFEKLLGRRMTPAEAAALHGTLNAQEMSSRNQEAQSAYSQLLGYRGLNADGTPQGGGSTAADSVVAAQAQGQASNPQQMAQSSTVGGSANLPQQVTTPGGGTATVSQGPIVTPYQQPPSPSAAAYQDVMQNNQPEVAGRTVASAMQAIRDFVGQK